MCILINSAASVGRPSLQHPVTAPRPQPGSAADRPDHRQRRPAAHQPFASRSPQRCTRANSETIQLSAIAHNASAAAIGAGHAHRMHAKEVSIWRGLQAYDLQCRSHIYGSSVSISGLFRPGCCR